jgi:hypothetical protein
MMAAARLTPARLFFGVHAQEREENMDTEKQPLSGSKSGSASDVPAVDVQRMLFDRSEPGRRHSDRLAYEQAAAIHRALAAANAWQLISKI